MKPSVIVKKTLEKSIMGLTTLIPSFIWYGIGQLLGFINFYFIGYRKKNIVENIRNAFPNWSELEIKRLYKVYSYRFFEAIAEMIVYYRYSSATLSQKVSVRAPDSWYALAEEGKNAMLLMSHQFNWEWAIQGVQLAGKFQVYGVYMPLKNPFFDRLMYAIRSKWGVSLIAAGQLKPLSMALQKGKALPYLISDQNPPDLNYCAWIPFFGREVPFHLGFDRIARKQQLPVYIGEIYRAEKHKYIVNITMLEKDPTTLKEGEIAIAYAKALEQQIRNKPENWLWSHRRWKHARLNQQQSSLQQQF